MRYQIWYMRPECFRDGVLGLSMPDAVNLSATHVHLKDIEAPGVEAAFHDMQGEVWSPNGEAFELIKSKGLEHTSMSVGDVAVDNVGNAHLVSTVGFKAIGGIKARWQDRAIASTHGTQFGAILACILDRKIPAPYFSGKASVTSDRFVMCNFTGSDGRNHMGAFVGSLDDLARNAAGLADHLKLSSEERAEYAAALVGWISTDYCQAAERLRTALG